MRYVQTSHRYRQAKSKKSLFKRIRLLVLSIILVILLLFFANRHNSKQATDTDKGSIAKSSQKGVMGDSETKNYIDATLQSKLIEWTEQYNGNYAVSVQEISGKKRTASMSASDPMTPASTYKVYVAYAILHKVEEGKLSLDDKTTTGLTLGECLTKMIVNSDNTCARALGFLAGWQAINSMLREQGLTSTDLNNYVADSDEPTGDKKTTAQDLTNFLVLLQQGNLLDKDNTTLLLDLMKRQVWRERINSGVPSSTVVANKPGWLDNIQTDAGIVYAPGGTFIIVILSTGGSTSVLATITSNVYNYLQSN